MDYLIKLIEDEYRNERKIEGDLVDLEASLLDPEDDSLTEESGLTRDDFASMASQIHASQVSLKKALKQYQRHFHFEDGQVADRLHAIIDKGYEQKAQVRIGFNPDYDSLADYLDDLGEEVSFIVDYKGRILNPIEPEEWLDAGVQTGDTVTLYLHNGEKHDLTEFSKYLGRQLKQESEELKGMTRNFKLLNQYGIHARPAALFIKTASRFDVDIYVEKDGNRVNGKSIMSLMTLEASGGTEIKVTADGPQAEELLDALEELINRKFDED